MFARTLFLLLFANLVPREFKVLANIENTCGCFSYLNTHSRIQELANYSEIKSLRNKGHAKIPKSTVCDVSV